MVVSLSNRRAMPRITLAALAISRQDLLIHVRFFVCQPCQQGGTEVEADPRVIVNDPLDVVVAVENARSCIWRIAFCGDAFIPVMKRIRRILKLNEFKPRILTWRLVEVTMNADVPFHQSSASRSSSNADVAFTRTFDRLSWRKSFSTRLPGPPQRSSDVSRDRCHRPGGIRPCDCTCASLKLKMMTTSLGPSQRRTIRVCSSSRLKTSIFALLRHCKAGRVRRRCSNSR